MTNIFLFHCNGTTVDHVLNVVSMTTLYGSYAFGTNRCIHGGAYNQFQVLRALNEYLPNKNHYLVSLST